MAILNSSSVGTYRPISAYTPVSSGDNLANASILSGLGNIFTGNLDYKRQKALIQHQLEHEERLSNTAYQRAVNDMRAAGLNPYLMYGSGSAATTPSISAYSPHGAGRGGSYLLGAVIGNAFQLARDGFRAIEHQARATRARELSNFAFRSSFGKFKF